MEIVRVSIIISVYNVEEYLRDCLDSAVNQTLADIEIICINDGSTDSSLEILNKYQSKDNRVRVTSQENKGVSAARNVGIRLCQGEYIYFLDSDDYLELNALELLYKEARDDNLDILYFDAVTLFESEYLAKKFASFNNFYLRTDKYSTVCSGAELYVSLQRDNMFHSLVQLQFISKQYLDSIGLFFYEGIYHEDNLFTFISVLQAKRVRHINKKLYVRRINEGSIMTQEKNFKHFYGYLTCYIQMLRFLSVTLITCNEPKYIMEYVDKMLFCAITLFHKLKGKKSGWTERLTEFEYYMLTNTKSFFRRKMERVYSYYKKNGFVKTIVKIKKRLIG